MAELAPGFEHRLGQQLAILKDLGHGDAHGRGRGLEVVQIDRDAVGRAQVDGCLDAFDGIHDALSLDLTPVAVRRSARWRHG